MSKPQPLSCFSCFHETVAGAHSSVKKWKKRQTENSGGKRNSATSAKRRQLYIWILKKIPAIKRDRIDDQNYEEQLNTCKTSCFFISSIDQLSCVDDSLNCFI